MLSLIYTFDVISHLYSFLIFVSSNSIFLPFTFPTQYSLRLMQQHLSLLILFVSSYNKSITIIENYVTLLYFKFLLKIIVIVKVVTKIIHL